MDDNAGCEIRRVRELDYIGLERDGRGSREEGVGTLAWNECSPLREGEGEKRVFQSLNQSTFVIIASICL